jgi:diguanylate cyclase (GGDEF)-like protein
LVKALYQKVKKLEKALQIAKKEIKIDFLTSALSKRGFEEELKRAEESFKRYGTNYSICFFDIDYFKIINDTYGHDAGDVILKSVGELFKRYTREVDIVGRYGGEEFIVVLPNIDLTGAIKFANKIRKIIKSNRFIYKGERIDVSISGGVSERKDYRNLEEAINAADEMLYKAKNSGRNKIMPEFG